GIGLGRFFVGGLVGSLHRSGLTRAARALRWTPPGLAGQAMVDGRAGRTAAAAGELALAALAVVALLAWWSASLERVLTTAEVHAAARRRGRVDLFPRGFGWLPRTRLGAVAAKELRYVGRDPRRRVLLALPFFVLGGPLAIVLQHRSTGGSLVLYSATVVPVLALDASNQVGFDGAALWV